MKLHHHPKMYLKTILILSVAGFIFSSYALYKHIDTASGSICNISEKFNCDIVNRSVYSEIAGIPVALIGMMGYALLFVLAYEHHRMPRAVIKRSLWTATSGAIGFTLYFAYVSGFVIRAWCIVCIGSYIATALILLSLIIMDFFVIAEEN